VISFNGKGVKKKKEEESGYFVDMDFSSCGMKATGVLGSRGALYLWRLSSSTRSIFLDSGTKKKDREVEKSCKIMVLGWLSWDPPAMSSRVRKASSSPPPAAKASLSMPSSSTDDWRGFLAGTQWCVSENNQ